MIEVWPGGEPVQPIVDLVYSRLGIQSAHDWRDWRVALTADRRVVCVDLPDIDPAELETGPLWWWWAYDPDDPSTTIWDTLPDGRSVSIRVDEYRPCACVRLESPPPHQPVPVVDHVPGRPCGGGAHLCPLCRALLGR